MPDRIHWRPTLSLLLTGGACLVAPALPAADSPAALTPFYHTPPESNASGLLTPGRVRATGLEESKLTVAFRAVTDSHPPGLVMIYKKKTGSITTLQRRPPRGWENAADPLFFALPLPEELPAATHAGWWDCVGTHADGAKDFFAWQLTAHGTNVHGRFDPDTDYNFAVLTGGWITKNRLFLEVEYLQNRYTLHGEYGQNQWRGTWNQTTGADEGSWVAKRRPVARTVPDAESAQPLYQWTHREIPDRTIYALRAPEPAKEWESSHKPLCLVWPP